jgi:hypothetical protein
MARRSAGWAGRTFKKNPLRGSPAWLTPVLLIGGAYLVIKMLSGAKKAVERAVEPPSPLKTLPGPEAVMPASQTIMVAGKPVPLEFESILSSVTG